MSFSVAMEAVGPVGQVPSPRVGVLVIASVVHQLHHRLTEQKDKAKIKKHHHNKAKHCTYKYTASIHTSVSLSDL